ncbi:MAG: hypothetical protein NW237_09270 [Cyanobacteriota bacterium]|nr:hypothetical protein [Cyanobacteriota bacterium]
MRSHFLQEPFLEFGCGQHICPRAGISEYKVYDTRFSARREKILVGAIGTSQNLTEFSLWLDKCSKVIPGKSESRHSNLYPSFCGFNLESGYKARFIFNEEITRKINNSDIKNLLKIENWNDRVNETSELYYQLTKFLAQNRSVDVIVCIIPDELYSKISQKEKTPIEESIDEAASVDILENNFRRLIKAKSMHLGKPIQLLRSSSLQSNSTMQQDDATKAWNFSTALYYKANQTVPWKLITNINRPSICFVGISFYRSRDRKILHTSLAQLFDELGNSVILRGTPVAIGKDDRQPHLTAYQAHALLKESLSEYALALGNFPARLVIHKSSKFNDQEIDGFRSAASEARVNSIDFVSILDTDIRLFRGQTYPPYRGTLIELDSKTNLLYTKGSVNYYKTYTGKYIPHPLEIRVADADESPKVICEEILALTKMNWNNTQFDGRLPITIQCSRKVGEIMKYLSEHDNPQVRYCYYM